MRPSVRRAALATVAATSAGASAGAQRPFEGAITVRMSELQQASVRYLIRRGMARAEMPGRPGQIVATILDPQKQTMTMLIPDRRAYLRRPLVPPAAGLEAAAASAPSTVERTGRMETVAGVQCEHVLVRGASGASDVCVAPSIGAFPGIGNSMMGRGRAMAASWRTDLTGQQLGFPLKVVRDGQTVWEVTKVERRALDPSLFTVPAGYQETQVPMGSSGGRARGGAPPAGRPPTR